MRTTAHFQATDLHSAFALNFAVGASRRARRDGVHSDSLQLRRVQAARVLISSPIILLPLPIKPLVILFIVHSRIAGAAFCCENFAAAVQRDSRVP